MSVLVIPGAKGRYGVEEGLLSEKMRRTCSRELYVPLPLLVVGKDVVGLCRLRKFFGRIRVVLVGVGVVLFGELVVSLFDVFGVCVPRRVQD